MQPRHYICYICSYIAYMKDNTYTRARQLFYGMQPGDEVELPIEEGRKVRAHLNMVISRHKKENPEKVFKTEVKDGKLIIKQIFGMAKPIVEEQMQAECFQWFWNSYPDQRGMLFHVKNNSYGDRIRGAINKALGVVAGVSDLVLIGHGKVFFIELKFKEGTQSSAQIIFQAQVATRGHTYVIIRSLEEFKAFVLKALNL